MVSYPIDPGFSLNQLRNRNFALFSAFRGLEKLAWVLILLFYSGAVLGLTLLTPADLANPDGTFARLLWYFTYVLILFLTVLRLPYVLRIVAFNPILIVCVFWCCLSFLWSVHPDITFRRAIALLMTTLAGLSFAARYDWAKMVQITAFAMLLLCIMSILVVLLMPARGIMHEIHAGAWRGPWVEKNQMGGVLAKGVAVALCAFAMSPKKAWLWIPTFLLCFLMVLMTTSKTSLLVALSVTGIFIALRIYRRYFFLRFPVMFFVLIVVSSIAGGLIFFPAEVLGLIGKDPTLTGRTDIWVALGEAISKKPYLGYGYGVFWFDPLGPSYEITSLLEWEVPTAHNGWVDSWLSGGAVLIGLFSLLLFGTLILAVRRIGRGGVECYWVILSTFTFIFFSMSESSILQQNDIAWFLFVATSSKLWAGEKPWWRPGSVPYDARLKISRR